MQSKASREWTIVWGLNGWIVKIRGLYNRIFPGRKINLNDSTNDRKLKMRRIDLLLVYLYCPDSYKNKKLIRRFQIIGKTSFEKQIFLLQNESALFKSNQEPYEFKSYKYGPHSWDLFHDINKMVDADLVKAKQYDPKGPIEYNLTDNGKEIARETWKQLSKEERMEIFKIKNTYNNWSLKDILSYVYNTYPDFISESEIVNQVLGTNQK